MAKTSPGSQHRKRLSDLAGKRLRIHHKNLDSARGQRSKIPFQEVALCTGTLLRCPASRREGRATYNTCLVGTVVVARRSSPTARPTRTSWPLSPNPSTLVATPSSLPSPLLLPPPLIETKRVSWRSPENQTFTAIRSRRIRTNHEDPAQFRFPPAPVSETSLRSSLSLRSSSSFPSLDLLDCQGSRRQLRGRYRPAPSLRSLVFPSLATPRRPYRRRRHSYLVFGFLFPTRRSLSK